MQGNHILVDFSSHYKMNFPKTESGWLTKATILYLHCDSSKLGSVVGNENWHFEDNDNMLYQTHNMCS